MKIKILIRSHAGQEKNSTIPTPVLGSPTCLDCTFSKPEVPKKLSSLGQVASLQEDSKNRLEAAETSTEPQPNTSSVINCPKCSSKRLYKDGLRTLANGNKVQRFLCRSCGYRFSQNINKVKVPNSNRQLCVILQEEAKKLDSQAEIKTVCAGLEKLPQDARGLMTKYMAYLEGEGYINDSAYLDLLKSLILKDGANLLDPEDVKMKIARHRAKGNERPWKNATKMLATYAYDAFCKMEKIEWTPPHYRQEETVLRVADEKDLDCFITGAQSKRMSAFYLSLKETFADPGEILRAEWVDLKGNVLAIKPPSKRTFAWIFRAYA